MNRACNRTIMATAGLSFAEASVIRSLGDDGTARVTSRALVVESPGGGSVTVGLGVGESLRDRGLLADDLRLTEAGSALLNVDTAQLARDRADLIAALGEIAEEADFTEDDGAMDLGDRLLRIEESARTLLARLDGKGEA